MDKNRVKPIIRSRHEFETVNIVFHKYHKLEPFFNAIPINPREQKPR